MKTLPKIEKCHCGSKSRLHYMDKGCKRLHYIACPNCGCSSYRYIAFHEAINGWDNGFFEVFIPAIY